MFGNIQNIDDENTFIFIGHGPDGLAAAVQNPPIPFMVPRDCVMMNIICIGAGSSGGGGVNSGSGVNRTGGRGGGSGAVTVTDYPISALPDVIYVHLAVGGNRSLANTTNVGSAANGVTCVSLSNDVTSTASVIGYALSGTTAGTGGLASTQLSFGAMIIANANFNAGAAGTAGNASAVQLESIKFTTLGGGGGGGTALAGSQNPGTWESYNYGSPTSQYYLPVKGGTAGGTNAHHPQWMLKPLTLPGGAGGGGGNLVGGGNGGKGAPGAGGGGSGGGQVVSGQGISGRGGDGMVIITCW